MREGGSETLSAADEDKLPPGGFTLRHGFPERFYSPRPTSSGLRSSSRPGDERNPSSSGIPEEEDTAESFRPPHIAEVLQYLHIAFDTEEVIDSVPLIVAANTSAWHAWRSYRMKTSGMAPIPAIQESSEGSDAGSDKSTSPRQRPGGARRPGEWNWAGVWEDRVRKSILASNSENMLYGGDGSDVVSA
jgi:hypothetical protein